MLDKINQINLIECVLWSHNKC